MYVSFLKDSPRKLFLGSVTIISVNTATPKNALAVICMHQWNLQSSWYLFNLFRYHLRKTDYGDTLTTAILTMAMAPILTPARLSDGDTRQCQWVSWMHLRFSHFIRRVGKLSMLTVLDELGTLAALGGFGYFGRSELSALGKLGAVACEMFFLTINFVYYYLLCSSNGTWCSATAILGCGSF